jgi:hypothetical protein
MITYNLIQGLSYLLLVSLAVFFSYRNGERSGSMYMLKYLKDNKFVDDRGYKKFIEHMKNEKGNFNE